MSFKHLLVPILLAAGCGGDGDGDTDGTEPPALELEGVSYQLNVNGLVVVGADPGLADLLRLFFTRTVLVGMHDVSDSDLTLRMGFAEDGSSPMVQDPCTQTLDLPAADRTSEFEFELGPETATFQGATIAYSIEDMYVSGVLGDDGDDIDDIVLRGGIDLRQVEVLGFGTAVSLCDTMADLGVTCGACADSEPYCAALEIEGISATRVDVALEAIDSLDPVQCPTTTP